MQTKPQRLNLSPACPARLPEAFSYTTQPKCAAQGEYWCKPIGAYEIRMVAEGGLVRVFPLGDLQVFQECRVPEPRKFTNLEGQKEALILLGGISSLQACQLLCLPKAGEPLQVSYRASCLRSCIPDQAAFLSKGDLHWL